VPLVGFNAELGESSFDDGFVLVEEQTTFSVAAARWRISMELLGGYGGNVSDLLISEGRSAIID
jgi:hypothetical protein